MTWDWAIGMVSFSYEWDELHLNLYVRQCWVWPAECGLEFGLYQACSCSTVNIVTRYIQSVIVIVCRNEALDKVLDYPSWIVILVQWKNETGIALLCYLTPMQRLWPRAVGCGINYHLIVVFISWQLSKFNRWFSWLEQWTMREGGRRNTQNWTISELQELNYLRISDVYS